MKEATIPLFPLNRVLFPKMILPLHIFEDRYKEMISHCLENGIDFGIVTPEGLQSGAIGCAANVHKILHKYKDGRMDMMARGQKRFRLVRVKMGKPYYQGVVQYFDDVPGEDADDDVKVDQLVDMYKRYIARMGLKNSQVKDLNNILTDINGEQDISYVIGQTIGLDLTAQQDLLAKTSGLSRIDFLIQELQRQNIIHQLARELFEKESFNAMMN